MRVIAAFALIPMLLGLAAAPAPAQTPGGSIRASTANACTENRPGCW